MSSSSRLPKPNVTVRCMSWNDNATALGIGTDIGFTIYSTEPVVNSSGGGGHVTGGLTSPNFSTTGVPVSGNGGYLTEVCARKIQGGVGHLALYRQSNMILFSGCGRRGEVNTTATSKAGGSESAPEKQAQQNTSSDEGRRSGSGGGVHYNNSSSPDPSCQVTLWNDALITEYREGVIDTVAAAHGLAVAARSGVVATINLQTSVVAMRLHPNCVVVAEEAAIHVMGQHLTLLESYSTPLGILAAGSGAGGGVGGGVGVRGLTINDNSISLATFTHPQAGCLGMLFLGPSTGTVRACLLYEAVPQEGGHTSGSGSGKSGSTTVPGAPSPSAAHLMRKQQRIKNTGVITPHQRPIRCLCITPDGSKGATISENGTAVKIIDVLKGLVLTQLNRGATASAVSTMSFNPEGTLFACLSESGTLHFFSIGSSSSGAGGSHQTGRLGGATGLSGKTANPKSKLGSWGSTAIGYAPGVIAGSQLISNAAQYANSEYSLATFSLTTATNGTASVADDIENERSDTFSSTFAAIALCPGLVGRSGRGGSYAAVFAAQGNNEEAIDEEEAGLIMGFSGPRCKLVKVGLDLSTKQTERLSTNYFPREEL